ETLLNVRAVLSATRKISAGHERQSGQRRDPGLRAITAGAEASVGSLSRNQPRETFGHRFLLRGRHLITAHLVGTIGQIRAVAIVGRAARLRWRGRAETHDANESDENG